MEMNFKNRKKHILIGGLICRLPRYIRYIVHPTISAYCKCFVAELVWSCFFISEPFSFLELLIDIA